MHRRASTSRDQTDRQARARLDLLFEEHSAAVYGYARRRLPHADAEEVVCDVFVVAWRRLSDVPDQERAWLVGVARRTVANRLRSSRRQDALTERAILDVRAATPDHAPGVDAEHHVRWALSRLRPADREIVVLLLTEGLTTVELGVVLGCSTNTASTRARRARQRFAAVYDGDDRLDRGADSALQRRLVVTATASTTGTTEGRSR